MIEWKHYGRLLIRIDAANLELSVRHLGWQVAYSRLHTFFRDRGQLARAVFYSVQYDTDSHKGFLTVIKKAGFRLNTKPIKVIQDKQSGEQRKANFDVEIAVDAMKWLGEFDSLVLFSGDGDFDYLVRHLRSQRKQVVVCSTRYHISRELLASADEYLDLRDLKAEWGR